MNAGFNYHVSEDVLETYAMGKLSDEDCAPLEEHLLLCCICQRRLAQTDEYIRVVKAAASRLRPRPALGIRRFVPQFRIAATIPPTALLFPS
jgi:anti-sigma factor RsiW